MKQKRENTELVAYHWFLPCIFAVFEDDFTMTSWPSFDLFGVSHLLFDIFVLHCNCSVFSLLLHYWIGLLKSLDMNVFVVVIIVHIVIIVHCHHCRWLQPPTTKGANRSPRSTHDALQFLAPFIITTRAIFFRQQAKRIFCFFSTLLFSFMCSHSCVCVAWCNGSPTTRSWTFEWKRWKESRSTTTFKWN